MHCQACSRRTLGLFVRSFANLESTGFAAARHARRTPSPRFYSDALRPLSRPPPAEPIKPFATNKPQAEKDAFDLADERPAWLVEKEATKRKLGGVGWNPRKKLSPDTMEGIRHLHQTQPDRFTTPVLAEHFKVSPEAIKRILKSKWRPTDEEQADRMRRWDKRGEQIWSNLVELGVKPPKKWREMGVGKAQNAGKPKWKSQKRNTVTVQDSVSDYDYKFENPFGDEGLIPIVDVDGTSTTQPSRRDHAPLSKRMGV